jgi:hypothetical protein
LYAKLCEDLILRDAKWKDTYDNNWILMWDNTALSINIPGAAKLQ